MNTPPRLRLISPRALTHALSLRDLTDPTHGRHAMQQVLDDVVGSLAQRWSCRVVVHRSCAMTTVADNYDRLHYPPAGVARDARYTRYVTRTTLLRTHTSAEIPPLLRVLAASRVDDVLLVCPGLVYRRDAIDRLHTGEPHQVDLWRLRAGALALTTDDLHDMMAGVVEAALPDRSWRAGSTRHPYTDQGREIMVEHRDGWVEIGECGLASRVVLADAGIDEGISGLAMGLGLDRILMLRKGLDDIRLLRASEPRVARQMLDLSPYRPVSTRPRIRRDMSIAVAGGVCEEDLGDRVRAALGPDAGSVEEVSIVSDTGYAELPAVAVERLGMSPSQRNVLLRVVLCDLDRTLTHEQANELRDRIYAALHEGRVSTWARGRPPED